MAPLIVILTDFGTKDPFVGIMKGVLAQIAPSVPVVDLTNEIPPGDIRRGGITLKLSLPYFPLGSTFLAVVDPGVGTERRPLLLRVGDHTFIGPDNGLFTFILGEGARAWELQNPDLALPNPGTTFHGRDIFAPAAAHAALGIPGSDFGPEVSELQRIPLPLLEIVKSGILRGEVLYPDRFGNVLTSLGQFRQQPNGELSLNPWVGELLPGIYSRRSILHLPNQRSLSWVDTFDDLPEGKCGFLVGSSGLLEIVANRRNAFEILNLEPGQPLTLIDAQGNDKSRS